MRLVQVMALVVTGVYTAGMLANVLQFTWTVQAAEVVFDVPPPVHARIAAYDLRNGRWMQDRTTPSWVVRRGELVKIAVAFQRTGWKSPRGVLQVFRESHNTPYGRALYSWGMKSKRVGGGYTQLFLQTHVPLRLVGSYAAMIYVSGHIGEVGLPLRILAV